MMSLVLSIVLSALVGLGPASSAVWKVSPKSDEKTIVLEGAISDGYFVHSSGYNAVSVTFGSNGTFELVG